MAFTDKTETTDVVDRWPYAFQHIGTNDEQFDYIGAFANEMQRIDVFIDELYEQRFVSTATSKELEKLGAEVGVTRRAGESDDDFRFRVKLGKAVAASDGTADDIESIISLSFDGKDLSNIDVTAVDSDPITRFAIPQSYLDDIPLTQSEYRAELEEAFPCGYGVQVVTSDTWLLGESGSQGIGKGGLI